MTERESQLIDILMDEREAIAVRDDAAMDLGDFDSLGGEWRGAM